MTSLIRLHYDPIVEFERLFDDAFSAHYRLRAEVCQRAKPQGPEPFRPRLDLYESKDSNTVTATFELPGLTSRDVTIDVRQNRLTVSGESVVFDAREENGYAVRERQYGEFSRMLQLPVGTRPEDVKAKMENGILALTFPKATPEEQPQRIPIQ